MDCEKGYENESFTFSGANKTRYFIYISNFKGIMYIINGCLRLIINTYLRLLTTLFLLYHIVIAYKERVEYFDNLYTNYE